MNQKGLGGGYPDLSGSTTKKTNICYVCLPSNAFNFCRGMLEQHLITEGRPFQRLKKDDMFADKEDIFSNN